MIRKEKKEEKERAEIAQVHYLNEFVDMTSHNLIGRHTRENLQVLSSDDLIRPLHRQPSIVPNTRWMGIGLLLSFVGQAWFLQDGRVISSTEVAEEAVFIVSVLGIARVTGGPFLTMRTVLFPILDSGLFFFDLIFTYMSWLNLVIISAQRKHLLKK